MSTMTRTTPVLLRWTAVVGLAAFWLAAVVVVAVLLSWPVAVVVTLAVIEAGLLALTLALAARSATRMRRPRAAASPRRVAPGTRLHNAA